MWVDDCERWHLSERCNEDTRTILKGLVEMTAAAAPGVDGPDWSQKYYVAWRVGGHNWMRVITRQSLLWLNLRTCSVSVYDVARDLGGVVVERGEPARRADGSPIQVRSGNAWPLRIMLRTPDSIVGAVGEKLKAVIEREWKLIQAAGGSWTPSGPEDDDEEDSVTEDLDVAVPVA